MISGVREAAIASSPPSRFWTAAVAMIVRGQSELAAIALAPCSSSASPRVHRLIPYLAIV